MFDVARDIGRLTVQCSMEPGLAAVFLHILEFDGNEFYFSEWPELIGKRFADACFMFEDAVCIGIRYRTAREITDEYGTRFSYINLNPPEMTLIEEGDRLIFIAKGNDTYQPGDLKLTNRGPPPDVDPPTKPPPDVDPPANEEKIKKMLVMIAEILDPRTAQLLELASTDDSNSMALGQMAMEKDVRILVEDLLCPAGSEMHIKNVGLFAQPGESLSYWEMMNRARQRVEIAIGFELSVTTADKMRDGFPEGVMIINPVCTDSPGKSAKVTWMPNDRIIVISED